MKLRFLGMLSTCVSSLHTRFIMTVGRRRRSLGWSMSSLRTLAEVKEMAESRETAEASRVRVESEGTL